MNNVIDLNSKRPHMAGAAVCLQCKHEWQAVAPVGVFDCLECPKCTLTKGCFKSLCLPEEHLLWQCKCGNYAVLIIKEEKTEDWGFMCMLCGTVQQFP